MLFCLSATCHQMYTTCLNLKLPLPWPQGLLSSEEKTQLLMFCFLIPPHGLHYQYYLKLAAYQSPSMLS